MHFKNNSVLFIGKTYQVLDTVDSTNTYLKSYISKIDAPEGMSVIAKHQYAGRGQANNKWISASGKNITVSILLKPLIDLNNQFMLNKIVCLAIYDLLIQYNTDDCFKCLKVKWPNDIYVNNKKIGGVLIENIISGAVIKQSVIGIGLNINQKQFDNVNAISLSEILDREVILEDAYVSLFQCLEKRYLMIKNHQEDLINNDYLAILYGINEHSKYRVNGEVVEGEIIGVSLEGKLMVRLNDVVQLFNLKELEFII